MILLSFISQHLKLNQFVLKTTLRPNHLKWLSLKWVAKRFFRECSREWRKKITQLFLQSIVCLAVLGLAAAGLVPTAYIADDHYDHHNHHDHHGDTYVSWKWPDTPWPFWILSKVFQGLPPPSDRGWGSLTFQFVTRPTVCTYSDRDSSWPFRVRFPSQHNSSERSRINSEINLTHAAVWEFN